MSVETGVSIAIDARKAKSGAAEVNRAFDSISHKAASSVKSVTAPFNALKAQLFSVKSAMLGMGASIGAGLAINTIGQFEDAMAAARAVTGATEIQFASLNATARELGATTKFTASEAASGMKYLGMAGFETNQIIAAMPGTLNLAAAASMDLASAADIASNIMTGFGIAAEDMTHVADVLATVAASANTNVEMLGEGMKYVAPIAKSLNISVESTSAALGVLANAGIQASMGGAGLRRVLSGLIDPSKEARKVLASVGISLADIDPRANSLQKVFSTLKPVLQDASNAFTLFDQRGAAIALTLSENVDGLGNLEGKLQDVDGAAAEMARIMNDTVLGSLRMMKSAFDELILSSGDAGLTGAFRGIIDVVTQVMRNIGGSTAAWEESSLAVKTLTIGVKALTVALTALIALKVATFFSSLGTILFDIGAALVAVNTAIVPVTAGMAGFGVVSTAAAASTGGFAAALAALGGPITLVIGALAGLTAAYFAFREELNAGIQALGEWAGVMAKASQAFTVQALPDPQIQETWKAYQNQIKTVEELKTSIKGLSDAKKAAIGESNLIRMIEREEMKLQDLKKSYLEQRQTIVNLSQVGEWQGPVFPGAQEEKAAPQKEDKFAKAILDIEAQIEGTKRLIAIAGENEAAIKREETAIEARRQAIDLDVAGTEKEIILKAKLLELTEAQIKLDRERGLDKLMRERIETDALAISVQRATDANEDAQSVYNKTKIELKALTMARELDVAIGSAQYDQLLKNLQAIEENNAAIRENVNINRAVLSIRMQLNLASEEQESRQRRINELLIESHKNERELAIIHAYLAEQAEAAFDRQLAAARDWESGVIRAMRKFKDEATDTAQHVEDVMTSAVDGMTDALSDFFTTGKADFESFAQDILSDINRILIKQMVVSKIMQPLFGNGQTSTGLFGSSLGSLLGGTQVPTQQTVPIAGGGGGNVHVSQTYNIQTPDAGSFKESQNQILARSAVSMQRAMQRSGAAQ